MKSDIDIEYENIFGVKYHPSIFENSKEEYSNFRQYIIDTPRVYATSSKLPFEDIHDVVIPVVEVVSDLKLPEHNYENINISNVIFGLHAHIVNVLTGILSTLSGNTLYSISKGHEKELNKHIFWITIRGKCNAYGYFNGDTGEYCIGEGSLISKYNEKEYANTLSSKNRKKIIDKYGINTGIYIKLKSEIKCPTPSEAAQYVLGASVNMDLWKDSDNKNLYDVFPNNFFR